MANNQLVISRTCVVSESIHLSSAGLGTYHVPMTSSFDISGPEVIMYYVTGIERCDRLYSRETVPK